MINPIEPFDCDLGHKKTMYYGRDKNGDELKTVEIINSKPVTVKIAVCKECCVMVMFADDNQPK